MMRAGALASSRSSSRVVRRNGAKWLTAHVSSMPSCVSCRERFIAPALLMRTSILAWRSKTSAANWRTAACAARSAIKLVTRASLRAWAWISAAATFVRTALRPTMATWAPSAASAFAVARPMPLVPPVMSTCFSCIGSLPGHDGQSAERACHRRACLWLSAPAGEDPAAGDGYQVQATPQSPNSADVAPLLRCDRLGFQLPARQQRVPEGVIGLMHDHAFKTSEEELALTRVCHGDVGDLFGEADGQANVRAVRGVTQRWTAKPLLRLFPSRAVDGIEFPGFPHVVHKAAGDNHVQIDVELGIGGSHLLGDADRQPRHTAQMVRLITALGLVDVGVAGRRDFADRLKARVGDGVSPRFHDLCLQCLIPDQRDLGQLFPDLPA